MALYYLRQGQGRCLVSARDGNHARELAECPDAEVMRILENMPHGVLDFDEPTRPVTADEADSRPDDAEIDITTLGDRPGTRRMKNLRTGAERIVAEG